jgi:hypothetical protein
VELHFNLLSGIVDLLVWCKVGCCWKIRELVSMLLILFIGEYGLRKCVICFIGCFVQTVINSIFAT